jgi:DNA-directed RNA polymerase subunit F
MADLKIVSENPISSYILRKQLEQIKEKHKELNLRANRTLDYLNNVTLNKDVSELFDKIMKLNIPRLKEQHVNKIIDIAPTTTNQLKYVLQHYTITLTNESMAKIVEVINESLGKK